MKPSLAALLLAMLTSCALLAPVPPTEPGPTSPEPTVNPGQTTTPLPPTPTTPSSPARPRPADNFATAFAARPLSDLLRPNDPSLTYPIYSRFSQVEPMLNQRNDVTYIINFWATWCRPCIKEMPLLETYRANNPGVEVIAISLDKPGDVRTKMKDYLERSGLQLPVIALTDDAYDAWRRKISPRWTRTTIPVTYVYRNGRNKFNKGAITSQAELDGLVRSVQ